MYFGAFAVPAVTMLAAAVITVVANAPDTPVAPGVPTQSASGLTVTWTAPNSQAPITSYALEVRASDGSTWTAPPTVDCDTASGATVKARTCTVPWATLAGATYTLVGAKAAVRVSATSQWGTSAMSPISQTAGVLPSVPT